jgi:hypothetical protein
MSLLNCARSLTSLSSRVLPSAAGINAWCQGALAGWLYVYASATVTALVWSTVWLAAGFVAYLGWARYHRSWPFGPIQVREAFLEAQREHPAQDAALDDAA